MSDQSHTPPPPLPIAKDDASPSLFEAASAAGDRSPSASLVRKHRTGDPAESSEQRVQPVLTEVPRRTLLPSQPVEVPFPRESFQQQGVEIASEAGTPIPEAAPGELPVEQPVALPIRRSWFGWLNDPLIRQVSAVLSVGLLIVAVTAIMVSYKPMMMKAGELKAAPVRVRIDWPPFAGQTSSSPLTPGGEPRTWLNRDERQRLEKIAQNALKESPTDAEAIKLARQGLMQTGWFTDALRVERLADGVVHIGSGEDGIREAGLWRFPVAVVRYDGRDHMVASGGERLPLDYAPDDSGYKVIVGVRSQPPEFGMPWGMGSGVGAGPMNAATTASQDAPTDYGDVQAGLKLLAYLHGHAALAPGSTGNAQIAAIDVSGFSPGKQLVIISEQGHRVLWGGPVGVLNPGQVRDSEKLARLAMLLKDYGRIDAGQPVLDIRIEGNIFVVDPNGALPPQVSVETKDKKSGGGGQGGGRGRGQEPGQGGGRH